MQAVTEVCMHLIVLAVLEPIEGHSDVADAEVGPEPEYGGQDKAGH